jgi:hypothetical protein
VPPTSLRQTSVRLASLRDAASIGTHRLGARAIAWVALAGQLALLAEGAIAHVTCAVHGDLVHATSSASARPASAHAALSASLAADEDVHERCLVDEDGDVACRPAPTTLPAPLRIVVARFVFSGGDRSLRRRAPLYRLAPKNSPPV